MTSRRSSGALRCALLLTLFGLWPANAASLRTILTYKTPYTSSQCSPPPVTNQSFTPSDQKVYLYILVDSLKAADSMNAVIDRKSVV